MFVRSTGAKRLGLVLGVLGATAAGVLAGVLAVQGEASIYQFVAAVAVGFSIPWGIVVVLTWIVEGFVIDRRRGRADE